MHAHSVTSVETKEALVTQDFLSAVEAVLIHEFSYKGAGGALVLHPRLHQVYRVHRCRARRYTQAKVQIIHLTSACVRSFTG